MEDGSIVIFGAGKIAERVYERIGQENIAAVIDNNVQRQGELFKGTIRIISLDEYIKRYYEKKILIASMYVKEIEEQLKSKRVYNYDIAVEAGDGSPGNRFPGCDRKLLPGIIYKCKLHRVRLLSWQQCRCGWGCPSIECLFRQKI